LNNLKINLFVIYKSLMIDSGFIPLTLQSPHRSMLAQNELQNRIETTYKAFGENSP